MPLHRLLAVIRPYIRPSLPSSPSLVGRVGVGLFLLPSSFGISAFVSAMHGGSEMPPSAPLRPSPRPSAPHSPSPYGEARGGVIPPPLLIRHFRLCIRHAWRIGNAALRAPPPPHSPSPCGEGRGGVILFSLSKICIFQKIVLSL